MMVHRYWRIALMAPVLGFLLGATVFGLVAMTGNPEARSHQMVAYLVRSGLAYGFFWTGGLHCRADRRRSSRRQLRSAPRQIIGHAHRSRGPRCVRRRAGFGNRLCHGAVGDRSQRLGVSPGHVHRGARHNGGNRGSVSGALGRATKRACPASSDGASAAQRLGRFLKRQPGLATP